MGGYEFTLLALFQERRPSARHLSALAMLVWMGAGIWLISLALSSFGTEWWSFVSISIAFWVGFFLALLKVSRSLADKKRRTQQA